MNRDIVAIRPARPTADEGEAIVGGAAVRSRIHAGRLSYLALLVVASASGCQTLQPTTPLTVHVRDAETQAPIPGATVKVVRFGKHRSDHDAVFTTADDGTAVARLAPPDEGGVMFEISAPNYLGAQAQLPKAAADALAEVKPFHPYSGPPLAVSLDMFAGPRPTAELVLPVGYRGVLKVTVHARTEGDWKPQQRVFTYQVPSSGAVEVNGPPVFGHGVGPDIVAKFADGTPLPKEAKGEEVALRWIRREGQDITYFVVGTSADASAVTKSMGLAPEPDSRHDGERQSGRRGGGGGGGRGGMGGMGGMGRGGRGGMGGGY